MTNHPNIAALLSELRESISLFDEEGVSRSVFVAHLLGLATNEPPMPDKHQYCFGRVVGLLDALALLWNIEASTIVEAIDYRGRKRISSTAQA